MKKCLIICWYGKLPDYFEIWQKSCAYNKDYDFIVITDQDFKPLGDNIIFKKMSLLEINDLINKKLDIKIKIEKPYKFCDFRPAYGKIFEDLLDSYEFWGHCDIDQVFGQISNFVTEEILNNYEKINRNGHFCLYKNSEKMNELYKKEGSIFSYKEVFTNNENYAFDEKTGIEMIVGKNNIKTKYIDKYADMYIRYKRYKMGRAINYKQQAFLWENGKLFRVYENNGILNKEELMYLHFQKKKPNIKVKDSSYTRLIMGSNYFMELENEISIQDIISCNPYKGKIYEILESIKYKYTKVMQFLKCSSKQKKVWEKQKRVELNK